MSELSNTMPPGTPGGLGSPFGPTLSKCEARVPTTHLQKQFLI